MLPVRTSRAKKDKELAPVIGLDLLAYQTALSIFEEIHRVGFAQ